MKLSKYIDGIFKILFSSEYRFMRSAFKGEMADMPDKDFLQKMFKATMGYELDLNPPTTFNEKLQWIKLYDRNPAYTVMVDKYLVKSYVAKKIGEKYVIPTLGVWESAEDIDFDILPQQFVLKCNHNSGLGMFICKDKSAINISDVRKKLKVGLAEDYYSKNREWPYKNVPRKIIAEQFLVDQSSLDGDLPDYKIHCFNGEPKFILVCKNRFSENGMTEDFFDIEWNHLDMKRPGHKFYPGIIKKPICFDEMIEKARILSEGIPFSRIDFYVINEKLFFGEITFFPNSGFKGFEPESWDSEIGKWIILPK